MSRDQIDCAFEVKAISEDGTFEGYGSVFGVIDSYKEIVAPGAFTRSLAELKTSGRLPALLWQHRSAEPIGIYTDMREDSVGLYVKGRLALKTARGAEAHELMKMKALDGLSIGFVTRTDSYDKVSGIRTLTDVDLWEVSPVTFPANGASRISAVKSIDTLESLADAERFLRDAGGLSKAQAVAFIGRIKSLSGRSESDELGEIMQSLKGLQQTLSVT